MSSIAAWIAGVQRPMTQRDVVVYVETHSIFWWLLIGLIAGWLAGTVARGRGFGCVVDVILGLIGAVIGGWIFERLGIAAFGILGKSSGGYRRRYRARGDRKTVRRRPVGLTSPGRRVLSRAGSVPKSCGPTSRSSSPSV